jgi:hypothetical protein
MNELARFREARLAGLRLRSQSINAIRIEPTFPIDDRRIRERYSLHLKKSLRSMGWMFLGSFARWMKQLNLGQLKSFCEWSIDRRDQVHQSLMIRSIRELASESNIRQDASISQLMNELLEASHTQYAISLGKFLLLKQTIERELHSDGLIDERRQYLERQVDALCHEVCREIHLLAQDSEMLSRILTGATPESLEDFSKKQERGHLRILHAYQTLSEIASKLSSLLNPGTVLDRTEETREFDRLLEVLKAETKIAQIVEERVRSELPPT